MKKTISNLKSKKIDVNQNQNQVQNKCDNQPLNIKKLIKPVEFEDVYFHNKSNISNDLNKTLVKIPDKDVEINKVTRKQTVFNNGVPTNIQDIYNFNLLAKLCIEFYTSDWLVASFKDFSYNGAFWSLPNIHSQLCTVKEQKFLIDEEKDNESILTFKTKGIFFESLLTVCNLEDYQKYLKYREDELANVINPDTGNNCKYAVPKTISFSLSELSDGMKVLKESMPRDGRVQVILYLDVVDTVREIGEYWILLSFKGKQKAAYLFAGSKENQKLWLRNLKEAIETAVTKVDGSGSQDSLERTEDTVQGMLTKILQESEQTATALRKKDHQKILAISPDVRDHITKNSKATPFHDTGLIERPVFDDGSIRGLVKQTSKSQYFKLTTNKFLTGVQFLPENNSNKDLKTPPEPFFISCCLLHASDGRRISEEFQWNPNHSSMENLLPQELFINKWSPNQVVLENVCNKTPSELPTFSNHALQNCKSFVVKIPYPRDQVRILIKVDKVFNGVMSSAVDKYVKYGGILMKKLSGKTEVWTLENSDIKTGQSIHKSMATFCSNIGNYRMPFCWSVSKFDSVGPLKLQLYKYDGTKTSDDDLFKQVPGFNPESTNKIPTIPGFIELTIEEISEETINDMTDLVNSELVCKIKSSSIEQLECCKEIKEFIFDSIRTPNSYSSITNQTKSIHSIDNSSSTNNSKSHSNFGSSLSLHYSDDNSPGDVTPPGETYLANPYTKAMSYTKTFSASLSRISGGEVSQALSSKSLDIPDHMTHGQGSINQEDLVSPLLEFSHCLYLYPKTLNFSNQSSFHRARNLSCFVELRDTDKPELSVPLKVIFSRPSNKQPAFDSWANTSVIYHDSSPTFTEEIKIALPVKLHARHHLLFRFCHVSCDTAGVSNARDKASNKKHLETQVGFAWLKLLDPSLNLQSGTFHLPVSTNLTPDYLDDRHQMKRPAVGDKNNIQWVDGQKSLFSIILKPESTIYTQNIHLHKFFRICTEKFDVFMSIGNGKKDILSTKPRSGSDSKESTPNSSGDNNVPSVVSQNDDVDIKNAIKGLGAVNVTNLILFLGPTFNQLFVIVVNTCTTAPEISQTAVTSIISLASTLRGQSLEALPSKAVKRNTKILKNYIKYCFDADKIVSARSIISVHECLVQTISDLISPPFRDTNLMHSFLYNSFLLYSIIVKSMIQSSTKPTKITNDRSGEKGFTPAYMLNLGTMIHLVISCILDVSNNSSNQQITNVSQRNQIGSLQPLASSANKDLARFISRLLNVMNRGFVFLRIHQYMKIINMRIDSNGSDRDHLSKMKFEFLEIICQHEHFLPLNLINLVHQSDKAPPVPELLLSEAFCQRHYLVGLVLQQVHQKMCDTYSSCATRRIPFVFLRNLLAKHIFDDRYNNNSQQQSRIAGLYLPFIAIILENQQALCMPGTSYSRKIIIQNINDHSDRSLSSRPLSTFSGDTISTHSSTNGSGSEGAGGSIYGVGFGTCNSKSTRNSQVYLDKEGHVESHFLNMIAGLNTEGSLRSLSSRRHVDSDSSSVHSTSTLIGLEEMNEKDEKEETNSLGDEMIIHRKIDLTGNNSLDSNNKRNSLQRQLQSNNNSIGKKAGLSLALKRNSTSHQANQRVCSGLGVNAASCVINKPSEIKSSIFLNEKTQKDVFICLMHIFSTISPEDMKSVICNLTVQERAELLQLMIYAIHHLKYQGKKVINNFESISKSGLASGHGQFQLYSNSKKTNGFVDEVDQGNHKAIMEGNVSTEVGLIVLDVLSVYCSAYKQEILTYNPDHVIFRRIVDVYLTLLVINQSDTVLRHVLMSMRVFVATFAKVIFASCHSVICDLSLHVLRYCDSLSSSVRIEACGFLYRMMRCSYDTFDKAGFSRVHLQMIVAVSKLDRTVGRRFNQSLNYLRRLAELEMQKTQSNQATKGHLAQQTKSIPKMSMQLFFEEVSDLTQRIRTVLMATVQMNEHKDDPEMLVDLQYSLAKSYSSNPALRRTWLEKIYAVHETTNSKAEMAMCKAHIAAMISEYLKRKELYLIGCANFKNVSQNIPKEESGMRDDSAQLEVHYTNDEVVQLLRVVAQEFDSAGLWEVLRHIYTLLIPIYEKKRDYEQLAQIYQHLAAAYIKIKNSEATNQRLIGSYYRVVLYGKPFESLAGKVFIYRLDSGKQFCVAREELQRLFENKYGADKVQMLVENHVDRGKLDPELASIQVTHVDPFFDEEEEHERQSMFECQYNISKFLLETPFVKRAQDDVEGILKSKQTDDLSMQWKRRTILTVEASFPHLKRRLEVVSTKEIDFSPIERAIDEIKSKNRQLVTHLAFSKQSGEDNKSSSSAVSGSVVNNSGHSGSINLLMDMHLTGALLPQVNQGPMAYARVFLQKESQINLSSDNVRQLKIQFMEFLSLCHLLLCDYYELMSHVHEPKYLAMRSALDKYRVELSNLLKEEITVDDERMVISTAQLSDLVKKDLMKRLGTDTNTC